MGESPIGASLSQKPDQIETPALRGRLNAATSPSPASAGEGDE
jgi:hypothetical protein